MIFVQPLKLETGQISFLTSIACNLTIVLGLLLPDASFAAEKYEAPSRVVMVYPQNDIKLTLDLSGYYHITRFEVFVGSKRFFIPENACEDFGIRIEQIHIVKRRNDEKNADYFNFTLFGNETIGEDRTIMGSVPYEIVPTCEIDFDLGGFIASRMSVSPAYALAPQRQPNRRWTKPNGQ